MGTSLPSTRQSKQQNKSQRCSSSSLSSPLLLPWPWLRIKHLDHRLMPMPPTTSTSLDMVMVDTHFLVLDTTIQATSIMDTDPLTIHIMDMDPLTMDMEIQTLSWIWMHSQKQEELNKIMRMDT